MIKKKSLYLKSTKKKKISILMNEKKVPQILNII